MTESPKIPRGGKNLSSTDKEVSKVLNSQTKFVRVVITVRISSPPICRYQAQLLIAMLHAGIKQKNG